ncbi:low molecular weight phosphotyrosine protein phosphatase [bacterium]|nr:low molecular weight phosphotyrosine protein phosphatase [bacterium]MBU1433967.1 low molecular weight phosphotyrosine protein phosphatase [bacterium]MBU1502949.1 low molecular weight phosphotyrosine protein phosphatase [bacterium]
MKSVLFVCLGNICRSPLAEGYARKVVLANKLDIVIDSAGTGNWHVGEAPCENSIRVGLAHGIDIAYLKARQVKKEDFNHFDLIVALDENNYRDLKKSGAKNLVKLGDYGYKGKDVPDPYFFDGFEGFEEVYKMIEICVNKLFSVNSQIKDKV